MKNILVVDDSLIDAALTIRAVRKENPIAVISTAIDGEDALYMIAQRKFDLILLDMNMPRIDGFELLTRIRAECADPAEVVAISGSRSVAQKQAAKDLGVEGHVFKAVDFEEFSNALNLAISRLQRK